jgi:hypothetical protein
MLAPTIAVELPTTAGWPQACRLISLLLVNVQALLDVSLAAPGRVTLPRSPPHSLLLSGSLFNPFPTGWGLDSPIVARWTGNSELPVQFFSVDAAC